MTNLMRLYGILGVLCAGLYAFALHTAIERTPMDTSSITSLTLLFAIVLTTVQSVCLRFDDQRAVRYNVRLRYTFISILVSALATATWAFTSKDPWVAFLLTVGGIVAITLIGLAVADRRRIKGYTKRSLFQ